jgi:putative redox protein
MTQDIISARWLGNMAFEGDIDGHKVTIDALPQAGGQNLGARPKPLMLLALAGCTAMDVVAISRKMRIEIDNLNIIVSGDLTDEYPKRYHSMHVIYEIAGKDLPLEKLEKIVKMSEDKYCGVSAVYKNTVRITSEIRLINK